MTGAHEHRHHHTDAAHAHRYGGGTHASPQHALLTALIVIGGFAIVELIGGWLSGSLALISDAGHMASDAVALALATVAAWIARMPPSQRHSYGLARAEVIAASLNGLLMLGVIVWICYEAVQRLQNPQPVAGGAVMAIAGLGLLINLFVAHSLSHGAHDMNSRAALLHVLGDLLGSVAALAAGVIVYFTGWLPIDPLLSLLVAGLVMASTLRLLRDTLNVLMEAVPAGLELERVGQAMARIEGVARVHDLHIWTLASGTVALSAHIEMTSMKTWPALLRRMQAMLRDEFDIDHATLQPEIVPALGPRTGKVIPIRERRS